MKCKYIKELKNIEGVREFFAINGIEIQKNIEKFFIDNNGGRPEKNVVYLENGTEKVVNSFLSFNEEDKDNIYKAKRRVKEDDCLLIPFARDPSGNYFCFKNRQIIFYSHEDGKEYNITKSFEEFINSLQWGMKECLKDLI